MSKLVRNGRAKLLRRNGELIWQANMEYVFNRPEQAVFRPLLCRGIEIIADGDSVDFRRVQLGAQLLQQFPRFGSRLSVERHTPIFLAELDKHGANQPERNSSRHKD